MTEEADVSLQGEEDKLMVVGRTIKSAEQLALIEDRIETQTFELSNVETVELDTNFGPALVAIQGDRSKPAIFTYHEAGVNYVTCFGIFLKSLEVSDLLQYFCVYHVTAPGQQRGAPLWSGSYPNITNLAEQVFEVVRHYKLSYLVGLGVGLGANVLARFAMLYPDIVRGLVLIRLSPSEAKVSIRDWITTKMSEWVLKHGFSGEKLADIIADKFGVCW
jgi:hypothetical protein